MLAALPQPPVSPRIQLKAQAERIKTLEARAALNRFLLDINILRDRMQKAMGRAHNYQTFLSYAWGKPEDGKFQGLKRLLRDFDQDLTQAGIQVWFDEKQMTGDVEAQMHQGIETSDLVLFFGTEVYQQKTQAGSHTNVKKELDFALEQKKAKPGLLKPLLLEGTFDTIFSAPGLDGYSQIMVDARWVTLEEENYDTRKYIHALTTYNQEVGILPAALDLPNAAQEYKRQYELCEEALQAKLEKIYTAAPEPDEKQEHASSFNPLPAAQLLPPIAAPSVAPELAFLQNQLADKEQAITAFLAEQGVASRQELQDLLDADTACLPNAKPIQLKGLNANIAAYEEALASLGGLEEERDGLQKKITALTSASMDNVEEGYSHVAVGVNSKVVHIKGNARDIIVSSETAAAAASFESPVLNKGVRANHSALGRNSKVVHIEGNAGNLSL